MGSRSGLRPVILRVVTGLCLLTLLAIFSSQHFEADSQSKVAEASQSLEIDERTVFKTSDGCSLEEIGRNAGFRSFPRSAAPQLDGYVVVTKQAFGGLLAVDYRCSNPKSQVIFRVYWHLNEDVWEVKKISPLPVK